MGRKRKKTYKKFDFDNYSLLIDIYKKDVVFFHINFQAVKMIDKCIITDELKKTLAQLMGEEFKDISRRRIIDVDMVEILNHRSTHIILSGYFKIFDDCEEYIYQKVGTIFPKIEGLFNEYDLRCERAQRYGMERNTKL